MTTFIIAAISVDGFIAEDTNQVSTSWTSKADKAHFVARTKEAGVIVMGSTTFESFGSRPLPDRRNIIYSHNKKPVPGVELTDEDPEKLLARLQDEGADTVAICGGSSVYTLFLERDLIDKIYLTIEGVLFGQGISLFNKKIQKNLQLVQMEKIGDTTILLEYKVIR